MPRLYIKEYTKSLSGKTVCIACREGILRDNFDAIVADIKFLNRQGIQSILYHNIAHRSANRHYFGQLADRLTDTRIVRVSPEVDFYNFVLDHEEHVHKLIFLERKSLIDQKGIKINSITTQGVRNSIGTWAELISNVNLKSVLERICSRIDGGQYDRVHILPAGKNSIKHELFTIEGYGTLIANNFVEFFHQATTDGDVALIEGILKLYANEGYIKPRPKEYLIENKNNFYITRIDEIVVGCVEKKLIDTRTVEIAALAISTKFRNQRVGVFTVQAFLETFRKKGYTRFISLTNNPNLKKLYRTMGFSLCQHPEYEKRQAASPGVRMYYLEM